MWQSNAYNFRNVFGGGVRRKVYHRLRTTRELTSSPKFKWGDGLAGHQKFTSKALRQVGSKCNLFGALPAVMKP
jgi:hypothetical protein